MRFKSFIIEGNSGNLNRYPTLSESTSPTFMSIMKKIHKDCKPFLKEWAKPQKGKASVHLLFSGRYSDNTFQKKKVRKDRIPSDTHIMIHKDMNDLYSKRFGYPARSTSLFCSGSLQTASIYGDPYVIFPLKKYKYLWSKEIDDLYMILAKSNMVDRNPINQRNTNDRINPIIRVLSNKLCNGRTITKNFKGKYNQIYGSDAAKKGYWDAKTDDGTHIKIPRNQNQKPWVWLGDNNIVVSHYNDMIWIPDISWDDYYSKYFNDYRDEKVNTCDTKAKAQYLDYLDSLISTYQTTELLKALGMEKEIMVSFNDYYMVKFANGGGDTIKSWVREFGDTMPSDDDIRDWWYHNNVWPYGKLGIQGI